MRLIKYQFGGLVALVSLLAIILIASLIVDPYASRDRAFSEFNETFSLHPSRNLAAKPGDVDVRLKAGQLVAIATGMRTLVSNHRYDIDPTRKYKLTVRLRVIEDDPVQNGARTYVGLATYDRSGRIQNSGVGAHRYGGMAGGNIKSEQGWVEVEGIFSGVGDEKHTQFRPGTSFVRPILILNNKSTVAQTEVASIIFAEYAEVSGGN